MTKPEKRNLLVDVLLAALIAIAYQEMITTVRASVQEQGLRWGTGNLAIIFSLTTLRFLIGNQMYLIDKKVQELPGLLWFFDLCVITLQTVIMVFLGGLSSAEVNSPIALQKPATGFHPSFFDLLGLLLVIDMLWILTLWLRKRYIPELDFRWGWFCLNGFVLLCLLGCYCRWGRVGLYSSPGLAWLVAANAIAFVWDVILLDISGLIKDRPTLEKLAAVDDEAERRV